MLKVDVKFAARETTVMGKKMRERRVAGGSKKGGDNVRSCRAGDTCPVCQGKESVVKISGTFETFGDGMAGMPHLRMGTMVFLPLRCKFCKTRFKEARKSIFVTVESIFITVGRVFKGKKER